MRTHLTNAKVIALKHNYSSTFDADRFFVDLECYDYADGARVEIEIDAATFAELRSEPHDRSYRILLETTRPTTWQKLKKPRKPVTAASMTKTLDEMSKALVAGFNETVTTYPNRGKTAASNAKRKKQ